jgi:hypothetical protein
MMLRFIYQCVVRAHPSWFRRRFADEMLSIFDHTEGTLAAGRLVSDGVFSLLRQWTLRPEFWEAPASPATPNGAPLFYIFESNKPRAGALLYGAFLSVVVLNGVCWTMGYAWNHPTFVWIQQPVIRPPKSWNPKANGQAAAPVTGEESLSTSEGRVLLVFKSHNPAPSTAASVPTKSDQVAASTAETPSVSMQANPLGDADVNLQSFVGSYVADSAKAQTVRVTLEDGRLHLEIAGEFRSSFVPVSENRLVAVGINDCSIEFVRNSDGTIHHVEIVRGAQHLTAIRR